MHTCIRAYIRTYIRTYTPMSVQASVLSIHQPFSSAWIVFNYRLLGLQSSGIFLRALWRREFAIKLCAGVFVSPPPLLLKRSWRSVDRIVDRIRLPNQMTPQIVTGAIGWLITSKRQQTWKEQLLYTRANTQSVNLPLSLPLKHFDATDFRPTSIIRTVHLPYDPCTTAHTTFIKYFAKCWQVLNRNLGKAHDDDLRLGCSMHYDAVCITCVPVASSCWTEGLKWPIDLAWNI